MFDSSRVHFVLDVQRTYDWQMERWFTSQELEEIRNLILNNSCLGDKGEKKQKVVSPEHTSAHWWSRTENRSIGGHITRSRWWNYLRNETLVFVISRLHFCGPSKLTLITLLFLVYCFQHAHNPTDPLADGPLAIKSSAWQKMVSISP